MSVGRKNKSLILLVYVWTVVSFLIYYSPTVFRLSGQAFIAETHWKRPIHAFLRGGAYFYLFFLIYFNFTSQTNLHLKSCLNQVSQPAPVDLFKGKKHPVYRVALVEK